MRVTPISEADKATIHHIQHHFSTKELAAATHVVTDMYFKGLRQVQLVFPDAVVFCSGEDNEITHVYGLITR